MQKKESELQKSCVKWFRLQYPHYKMLLFAIPNGGQRNIITATRLKAEGALAGVSDLFLSIPKKGFAGFYIEMKSGDNKLTEKQEDFFNAVQKFNYKTQVIRTFDQFTREIQFYLDYNH